VYWSVNGIFWNFKSPVRLIFFQKYVTPIIFGKKKGTRKSIEAKEKTRMKEVKKDVKEISKQVKAQEDELREAMKLVKGYLKQQAMLQGAIIVCRGNREEREGGEGEGGRDVGRGKERGEI
jgi:hypothetical protein